MSCRIPRYTPDMHTGRNAWTYELAGLGLRKVWITCNGRRVDMTGLGYPTRDIVNQEAAIVIVRLMNEREFTAASHRLTSF